jgi:hypothetical protein
MAQAHWASTALPFPGWVIYHTDLVQVGVPEMKGWAKGSQPKALPGSILSPPLSVAAVSPSFIRMAMLLTQDFVLCHLCLSVSRGRLSRSCLIHVERGAGGKVQDEK